MKKIYLLFIASAFFLMGSVTSSFGVSYTIDYNGAGGFWESWYMNSSTGGLTIDAEGYSGQGRIRVNSDSGTSHDLVYLDMEMQYSMNWGSWVGGPDDPDINDFNIYSGSTSYRLEGFGDLSYGGIGGYSSPSGTVSGMDNLTFIIQTDTYYYFLLDSYNSGAGYSPEYAYNLDIIVHSTARTGDVDIRPVPEPSTLLLLGSGLAGLVGFRRKFKG